MNSSSGITTTSSGARHIPSSTRPDGSKRKEIKIRPGYKPPEEIEVYKNRTAEAWKTRGVGARVPGAAGLEPNASAESKGVNMKNAKRREARKKAKETGEGVNHNDAAPNDSSKTYGAETKSSAPSTFGLTKENQRPETKPSAPIDADTDVDAEKDKQARNLKKKLRQARDLREKKNKGENLLPEQFEKVIKISELIRQLDGLGFNADGEPKEP